MSRKGSSFERWFCKRLSMWWADDPEVDDLFWRTHGSGARASFRTRRGKKTRGQYGDVCATSAEGESLTRAVTFSLKCGYNKLSLQDLLDRTSSGLTEMEKWVNKAVGDAEDAESLSWVIAWQRNARQPVLIFPNGLLDFLPRVTFAWRGELSAPVRPAPKEEPITHYLRYVLFEDWLQIYSADDVRRAVAKHA